MSLCSALAEIWMGGVRLLRSLARALMVASVNSSRSGADWMPSAMRAVLAPADMPMYVALVKKVSLLLWVSTMVGLVNVRAGVLA